MKVDILKGEKGFSEDPTNVRNTLAGLTGLTVDTKVSEKVPGTKLRGDAGVVVVIDPSYDEVVALSEMYNTTIVLATARSGAFVAFTKYGADEALMVPVWDQDLKITTKSLGEILKKL